MSHLGYSYRMDGNFLVRCICTSCGEHFDMHAMANRDALGRCPACRTVDKWIAESGQ
jgi:predicted nucleic acid-binding Zn ribbon protein